MKLISGKVRRLEQIPREKGEKIYLCTYFIFMCQSIYKFMIINNFLSDSYSKSYGFQNNLAINLKAFL